MERPRPIVAGAWIWGGLNFGSAGRELGERRRRHAWRGVMGDGRELVLRDGGGGWMIETERVL